MSLPKPYYDNGQQVIYHGDCRDLLPLLPKVDLLLTDPPYGLGDKWTGGGGSERTSWKFNPSEARQWDGNAPDFMPSILEIAKEAIIWGGNYFPLAPESRWLIWDKKQNDQWTTGQAELAWTNLGGTVRCFRYAQCEQATDEEKLHPTQKPLKLILWCFRWSKTKGVVLDPFMGSGTTLVGAKLLDRKCIGIEREERYCEIAARRLEDTTPSLFAESACVGSTESAP